MNDLYYLTHISPDPVPDEAFQNELALMQLTSNCLQSLISDFGILKQESTEDGIIFELPKPKIILPREKPLPKPKAQTRWEKFAASKGIVHRKKEKMVFDEITKKFVPRQWRKERGDPIIEAKKGVDDFEGAVDPFKRKENEKKERIEKNEKQQAKNVAYKQKDKMRQRREREIQDMKGRKQGKK